MKKNLIDTVIYYLPVNPGFIDKWEYYRVDKKMLNDAHKRVYIVSNIKDFIITLLKNKIDLVYFWWWHSSAFIVILSRILKIKVIGTGAVHMFDESGSPDFYKKNFLFRLLNRITWKLADKILFISESQFRQITSHELVSEPFVLKSSSIYSKEDLYKLSNKKSFDSDIQFLTVCWLTRDQILRKSIDKILKAVSILPKSSLDKIKIYIVGGNGDGIKYLKKLITDLGLEENVYIEIDVSNDRKVELYKRSDLYIQPSYYEGFGNSVLEAMTFGTPCIVSSKTAQPEVVGKSGYIINDISSFAIYEAISDYIKKTPEQRKEMVDDVRETLVRFHSYETRLKTYISLFD